MKALLKIHINSISFLIAFLFLFTACENDLAKVQQLLDKEEAAVEVAQDVELIYSDSAIVRVRVRGPELQRKTIDNIAVEEFPKGIEVDFFDNFGRVRSELTAKYAIHYESKKEIVIQDSVVWISKNGDKLETYELIWDEAQEKVYSKRFARITTPKEKIFGYGFEADQEFTRWKINSIEGEKGAGELINDLE